MSSTLPQKLTWEMAQNKWASQINPILDNPLVKGQQLIQISLTSGSNVINHKLGRKLQGWIITGINGAATIYDTQATNQMPELTLNLTSNASVTINLWVF